MNTQDWYVRGSERDGANYLNHYNSDITIEFVTPLEKNHNGTIHHGYYYAKNDSRIHQYKNTKDLIFSRTYRDGPFNKKMKMFGVNLNAEQLEELIRNAEDCLKLLKLESFQSDGQKNI